MAIVLQKTSRKYEEGNLWKPYGGHSMETIRLATDGNYTTGNQWNTSGW
jgi:hypothetical protein